MVGKHKLHKKPNRKTKGLGYQDGPKSTYCLVFCCFDYQSTCYKRVLYSCLPHKNHNANLLQSTIVRHDLSPTLKHGLGSPSSVRHSRTSYCSHVCPTIYIHVQCPKYKKCTVNDCTKECMKQSKSSKLSLSSILHVIPTQEQKPSQFSLKLSWLFLYFGR